MKINRVTITGADDQTDIAKLVELSDKYPIVEWGILHSPTFQGHPRYPTDEWIHKFLDEIPDNINCSLHLCGRSMTNFKIRHRVTLALCHKFDRVQLNFNALKAGQEYCADLIQVINQEDLVIITQHNDANKHLWKNFKFRNPGDHHILFDSSGGKGLVPYEYRAPISTHYCGYAGGLNPDNLERELTKMATVVSPLDPIWIDMETGVRTDEKFDFDKVERVLATVMNQCWKSGNIELPTYRKRPNRGKNKVTSETNIS